MFCPSSFWTSSGHLHPSPSPAARPMSQISATLANAAKPVPSLTTNPPYPQANPYSMALLAQYPWSLSTPASMNKQTERYPLADPWSFMTTPTSFSTSATIACDEIRKRRTRTAFNQQQLSVLEASFEMSQYPDAMNRKRMADATGLQEGRIQVWFKNRRAKERKKRKGIIFPLCSKFSPSYDFKILNHSHPLFQNKAVISERDDIASHLIQSRE